MPVRKLEQTLMVALPGQQQLALRRLADNPDGPPVLLLHGQQEDGTVFLGQQADGLAHFLAQQGFDVYIPFFHWGLRRVADLVNADMPALLDAIRGIRGILPTYWFTHRWGGMLANSFLASFPGHRAAINGLVHFGVQRMTTTRSLTSRIWLDGLRGWFLALVARLRGFIPGRLLQRNMRSEFRGIPLDGFGWLQGQGWQYMGETTDYGKALSRGLDYPPALYFIARHDLGYCNPRNVKVFMQAVAARNGRLIVLGKKEGNLHNYSHIQMIAHPDAARDHFSFMLNWLQDMSRLRYEAIHGDDPRDSDAQRSPARGR